MSTENQPQVTNDEPVLVLDDKKYLIENEKLWSKSLENGTFISGINEILSLRI